MTAKARIHALADGSRSVQELAALAGCSKTHVYAVVLDAGLPLRPASVKAAVIALADGRRTATEIADAISTTPYYVREVSTRLGLPVPRHNEHRGDVFENDLRWAAAPDRTVRDIVACVGAPYTTVKRRLARLGLPFKQCRRGRPRKEMANG